MRYMMIIKGDENFSASGPPPEELIEEIGRAAEAAVKSGKIVSMGGLKPSAEGAKVSIKNGKLSVTDGPFTEAKEMIGGFTIMNLKSKAEAIEEARQFMELHRKLWPKWEGTCEVRLMYEEGEHP